MIIFFSVLFYHRRGRNILHQDAIWASPEAQWVKNRPANEGDMGWSLGQEDPLEKEKATHSSILAWKIPWTEESGGLQTMGSQRVGHGLATEYAHTWMRGAWWATVHEIAGSQSCLSNWTCTHAHESSVLFKLLSWEYIVFVNLLA